MRGAGEGEGGWPGWVGLGLGLGALVCFFGEGFFGCCVSMMGAWSGREKAKR